MSFSPPGQAPVGSLIPPEPEEDHRKKVILILVIIIGVLITATVALLGFSVPKFLKMKQASELEAQCANELAHLAFIKELWLQQQDHSKPILVTPADELIAIDPTLVFSCPGGAEYLIGNPGLLPSCPDHPGVLLR